MCLPVVSSADKSLKYEGSRTCAGFPSVYYSMNLIRSLSDGHQGQASDELDHVGIGMKTSMEGPMVLKYSSMH